MDVKGVPVEDTYCEAFDGLVARMIVTAKTEKLLMKAITSATALPSTVFNEAEGGIEKILSSKETPDGRPGAIIQIWVNYMKNAKENLETQLGKRIRQGILVVPTTSIFNALESDEKLDMSQKVGGCGDGYEVVEERYGRTVINVPLMMGEFLIEKEMGIQKGIMGGNIWYFCDSEDSGLAAGDAGVEAVNKVEGVITSFDVCSAGSKVGGKNPEIGPTTNHPFCPTCKIADTKVPEGINSIPEIVIDGLDIESVKKSMRDAIYAAAEVPGVKKISAGNFGGKLGKHHIYLKDII